MTKVRMEPSYSDKRDAKKIRLQSFMYVNAIKTKDLPLIVEKNALPWPEVYSIENCRK